jgi:hypothetical protein
VTRQDCPDCGAHIVSVCGYHSKSRDITGYQPASYATPGEHFISSHHCQETGLVWVACHPCRLIAADHELNKAAIAIGGYWR